MLFYCRLFKAPWLTQGHVLKTTRALMWQYGCCTGFRANVQSELAFVIHRLENQMRTGAIWLSLTYLRFSPSLKWSLVTVTFIVGAQKFTERLWVEELASGRGALTTLGLVYLRILNIALQWELSYQSLWISISANHHREHELEEARTQIGSNPECHLERPSLARQWWSIT